jgi:hypothetical protein
MAGVQQGDDNSGEKGVDELQPIWFGVSTEVFSLQPGQCPVGTMESGLGGNSDSDRDADVDLTRDFGFTAPMTVGNLVFNDLNGDGVFTPGVETGIPGVPLEVWRTSPNATSPIGTVLSGAGGIYSIQLPPGSYEIRLNASLFQAGGMLEALAPSLMPPSSPPPDRVDDDAGQDLYAVNGNAQMNGARTLPFTLVPGQAPTAATGETGYLSDSDDGAADVNTNLCVDIGLKPRPLNVGNLVFVDVNENGRFDAGADYGAAGIRIELYALGDLPELDDPVDATTTLSDGSYHLSATEPGAYYLYIPTSEFGPGKSLAAMTPHAMFGDDEGVDDDADQNALPTFDPETEGVYSIVFELDYGTEPLANRETGYQASGGGVNLIDWDTDLTIDLGFVGSAAGEPLAFMGELDGFGGGGEESLVGPAMTFAQWQQQYPGLPTVDTDGDGLLNFVEYAVDSDPENPLQSHRFRLEVDEQTGAVNAVLVRPSGGRLDVREYLEIRGDQTSEWQRLAVVPVTLPDEDGFETLRFPNLQEQALFAGRTYGAVRLVLELDGDFNGEPEAVGSLPELGWLRRDFMGQQSFAQPLMRPALWRGPVQAVGVDTLQLSGPELPSGLADQPLYLEVLSGVHTGERFEVAGIAGRVVTVDLESALNTREELPEDGLVGAQVALHWHWTLADLFPVGAFTAGVDAAGADRLLTFDAANNGFEETWLGVGGWTGRFSDGTVLAPGMGLLVDAVNLGTVIHTGELRSTTFRLPLEEGAQLVGGGFLRGWSPRDFGLTEGNGLTAGAEPRSGAGLHLWMGDADGGLGAEYRLLQFRQVNGAAEWVEEADAGMLLLSNEALLEPGRAWFVLPEAPLPGYRQVLED